MVWETATTTDERRKIVSKLMPFLRAQTILTNDKFAEIGMRVRPVRSWQTVKRIHDRYLRGELWGHWRLSVVPEHEPIRVNRVLQDLRATNPNISLRECARRLGINWSTFRGINAKVAAIPPSKLIFSRRNLDFEDIYFSHLRLARDALRLEAFSLTHLGVTGCLIQLAERGVQIIVLLDWCQVLSPFELPCIKQLLVAKECGFDVKVYVQRSKYTTQHQKMFIVDNILVTTASANPSMNGLTKSFENLTLHFIAEEVDQATQQFSRDLEEDFFEVDQVWLRAEEQQVSSSRQLAAAMASEGPTAEELEALDFQPETDDIISEEVRH